MFLDKFFFFRIWMKVYLTVLEFFVTMFFLCWKNCIPTKDFCVPKKVFGSSQNFLCPKISTTFASVPEKAFCAP